MSDLPEGMTAWKLREIANWLDTYDELAEAYMRLRREQGDPGIAEAVKSALSVVRGKEVQDELRAWANQLPPITPISSTQEEA